MTQRRPGGRTARVRSLVLETVVAIVAERGFESLRYEEVAALSGVHKTTVYRNWPTREDLVSEALSDHAQQSLRIPNTDDLRADLVTFLVRLAQSISAPPGRAILSVAQAAGPHAPQLQQIADQVWSMRVAAMQERFDCAAEAGSFPRTEAEPLLRLLAGAVYHHLTWAREPFPESKAEEAVDIVLAGARHADVARG
ncbi:MAG: TetR/AcrR family transcriptional regulator C-terminal ligand-binding domain-containing protein [Segniliparus sp.]|uniref:TetR/AcrR family transcriptional regulator n=1 Tax=Segniliparus sp. TaxID=2804064 RepID=UPI003F2E1F15